MTHYSPAPRRPLRLLRRLALATGAVLLLALILEVAFPGYGTWLKWLVTRERNGCDLQEAVAALSYTARHRSLTRKLGEQSRAIQTTGDGLSLWSTPHGKYWAPDKDKGHLFVLAEVELDPYTLPDVTIRKGDVVMDCGAYLGQFTREALEAGASRVIAVEPGTTQMTCLRRTFAAEIAAGRVLPVQEGVWSAEGHLVFQDAGLSDASFVEASFLTAAPSVARVSMPVTTIDVLVERLGLDRVDLIKMDIEGSEQEALRGAARTLKRFKPKLAIAGYHKATDPKGIPARVREANEGYRFVSAGCRLDVEQIRPLTMFFF